VCDSQLCDEYRTLRGVPFALPDTGTVVDHGGATVTVVARDGVIAGAALGGIDEENERSLALLFEFGGRSVFIGGDLTGGGLGTTDLEAAVAAASGPVDVLRLNHHGSETSSSGGFLDALQPRAVVVSVGTDNAFCHPARSVVERLTAKAANVYATGDGIVEAVDRCDLTVWPAGARHGLGTFSLVINADGAMTLAGAPL
jgi:competence protein ComEC